MINWILADQIIKNALEEDIGFGDITTYNIVKDDSICTGMFKAKEDGVISGLEVAKRVFQILDKSVVFLNCPKGTSSFFKDGDKVKTGDIFAQVKGPTKSILLGERVALNFLQRMSGIATMTNNYVQACEGYNTTIVDTRKTAPNLRIFDKAGVLAGGGKNHRMNLSDAVMIKDNHIEAANGITNAVKLIRDSIGHTPKIEVEVKNLGEVREAIECKADIIMLDNMDVDTCREAVGIINKKAIIEVSGNMNEEKVAKYAQIGVDVISVGALTHSVKALDISMKIK